MIRKLAVVPVAIACSALLLTSGCRSSASSSLPAEKAETAPSKPSPVEKLLVVPAGTPIKVRLNSSLDTARSKPGEHFTAVLAGPIIVDGKTVLESGANVEGVVRSSESSGRLKGRAYLSIALDAVEVNGSSVPLVTDSVGSSSGGHKKRNLTLIGGGSGFGALVGGLAGGGRGALIGAGAGAAAGTAGAAITGKKQAHIAAESVLVFHLKEPLQISGPS